MAAVPSPAGGDAAALAMFESGWFGRGDAFWRWVETADAQPYAAAFVDRMRRPDPDEPFDLLGDDPEETDLFDPERLAELRADIERRFDGAEVQS